MRKQFLLLLILSLSAVSIWAERIDVVTAQKVAQTVAVRNEGNNTLRSARGLSLAYAAAIGRDASALRSGGQTDGADYFVFNVQGKAGFVIVAGDNRVRPVLGYSSEGSFDPSDLPSNMRAWLAGYQEEIAYAERMDLPASASTIQEWNSYLSGNGSFLRSGTEKTLETANWDQGDPYNLMCPTIDSKRTLTGCGATATAIVMRYHNWPERATNGVTSYMSQSLDYNSTYAWNSMSLEYSTGSTDTEKNSVAKLMWHIGANIEMEYGLTASSSSSTNIATALQDVFGYSKALRVIDRALYATDAWEKMLRDEIDADRPVIYGGQSKEGGHIFVCDGYASDGTFRINWGWGGSKNGNFALSALDPENYSGFTTDQTMFVGVKKDEGENPVYEAQYKIEPSSSVSPFPTGQNFNLLLNFVNTGSAASDFYLNVAIYDLKSKTLGNNLSKTISYTSEYEIKPGYGVFTNKLNFTINLPSPLQSYQRLVGVYSNTASGDRQILKGGEGKLYAFDMNGLAPMWYISDFADKLNGTELAVGNGTNAETSSFKINDFNASQDFNVRFTLDDASWASKLDAWVGSEKLTFKDGKAYIPKSKCTITGETVEYQLKLTSKEDAGEVRYTLDLCDADQKPLLSIGKGAFNFVKPIKLKSASISGKTGAWLPFTFQVEDLGSYAGKTVYVVLSGDLDKTWKLAYLNDDNTVKKEIAVTKDGAELDVLSLNNNVSYKLGIYSDNAYPASANKSLSWKIYDKQSSATDRKLLAMEDSKVPVNIQALEEYSFTKTLTNISITSGDVAKIKEGSKLSITLKASTNFSLPTTIQVKMGELDLVAGTGYTYSSSTGKMEISKVTGDVTMTAYGVDNRSFEVILNLTGIASTPSLIAPVLPDAKLDLTLKANEGHKLPTTITVVMGDKTLATTDYTYNSTTGAFSLAKVTGKLTITAKGVKETYSITATLTNLTSDIKKGAQYGDVFEAKLSANEGYNLPKEITMTMGGDKLVKVTDYTYDATTGKISLKKVTGELIIEAAGDLKSYPVKLTLKDVKSDIPSDKNVLHGETFTGKLSVDKGYKLPATIKVTMAGKELTVGTGYSYDSETGTIKIEKVTGEVVITATGMKLHAVAEDTENITISDLVPEVAEGTSLACTLSVDKTTHKLPYAIEVRMGSNMRSSTEGRLLSVGKDYTYNRTSGAIEVFKVSGDLTISAAGVQKGYYEIVLSLSNITSEPAKFVPQLPDSEVKLTLKASSGYTLPASITVKMVEGEGEKTLAAGTDYTYNASTGEFTLEKIKETIVIEAAGYREPDPEPTTYLVTLPSLEGATLAGESSTTVVSGESFAFTLTLKEGYKASQLTVKANGVVLLPKSEGRYVIENVEDNIVVTVTGIEKDTATDNAEVSSDTQKVWGENGRLHIRAVAPGTAHVVTFNGRLYKTVTLSVGETVTAIPQGSYIIYIGDQTYKIQI